MRVKILRGTAVSGKVLKIGEVHDLSETMANQLFRSQKAEKTTEAMTEQKNKNTSPKIKPAIGEKKEGVNKEIASNKGGKKTKKGFFNK